jgi:hypothetical protein
MGNGERRGIRDDAGAAGQLDGIEEDEFGRKVIRVEMSIPFARPDSGPPSEEALPVQAFDPLPESDDDAVPTVVFVTPEEGRAMFDAACRRELGMSGEEFLRRYDAGEFDGIEEDEFGRRVVELEMVIPFAKIGEGRE